MQQSDLSPRLKLRATDAQCAQCPPDRVCAWSCVQGAGVTDIVIGAMLEQSDGWAFEGADAPEIAAPARALWETFNG